jgi:hypothetical protein
MGRGNAIWFGLFLWLLPVAFPAFLPRSSDVVCGAATPAFYLLFFWSIQP